MDVINLPLHSAVHGKRDINYEKFKVKLMVDMKSSIDHVKCLEATMTKRGQTTIGVEMCHE